MSNIIQNWQWRQGRGDGPEFFTATGPMTYDTFSPDGVIRTRSLTMDGTQEFPAIDSYDIPVAVRGMNGLYWGYRMRAIDADNIILIVEYFDGGGNPLEPDTRDITRNVGCSFAHSMGCFLIPRCAECARLSMQFGGKITACTYGMPTAYLR